jgi:ubiquinone/menaquinone biosynthesis C-methylase UbiE
MNQASDGIFETKEDSKGSVLERRIGEGTFVGFEKRTFARPEDMVEWLKHLYAYRFAEQFATGNTVLDLGCGTGYGTNELSTTACNTIGLDIWRKGLRYCSLKYGARAFFIAASGTTLPFKDNSFDLVISFQVIEHIPPKVVQLYLSEIRRILKDNGVFIVATPNRRLRLLPLQKPWNKDHTKEYDSQSLENLLKSTFREVQIMGLFAARSAYMIEYKRVKQNPVLVYIRNPLYSLLSPVFHENQKITNYFSAQKNEPKNFVSNISNLSPKDFCTSKKNLGSCIDIYGICKK